MRTLRTLSMALTALSAGLFGAGAANATNYCEVVKSCNNGCYTIVSRIGDVEFATQQGTLDCAPDINSEADSDYVEFRVPLNHAPDPVAIDCVGSGGGQICEAWPKGDSVTYSWSTTGSFQAGTGTAANPFRNFSCTHGTTGTITVTALSPQGAASSITTAVSCP